MISIGESRAESVGIFFKSHDVEIYRRRDLIPGRLLMLDCFYQGCKYRLIIVYTAPESSKKMQLFKSLRQLLCVGYNIILCGDFNVVTEANDRISNLTFKTL